MKSILKQTSYERRGNIPEHLMKDGKLPILYCYRLDEETGKITQYAIEEYRCRSYSLDRFAYFYLADIGAGEHLYEFYDDNLDKVIHLKIHSFNSDPIWATNQFVEEISKKLYKAKKEYERWDKTINLVNYPPPKGSGLLLNGSPD